MTRKVAIFFLFQNFFGTSSGLVGPAVLFEQERERIFKTAWLNIGRVERIPNAGDYFVKDLAVCDTSVLVVRGQDGQIRAFHKRSCSAIC
jgi:hypothetical protein